jgi:hypothetical protein
MRISVRRRSDLHAPHRPRALSAVPSRVHFQLDQRTAAAQSPDFVHPATAVALEFHLEHLPGILALDAIEDRPQRQYLTRFERMTGAIMVTAAPVTAGATAAGPEQRRGRDQADQ